jgi:2-methylisocitrate lyase-like PEP mutase family enzyme
VNVLARPGLGSIEELAAASIARVSVGGSFAFLAYEALARAAVELRVSGTFGYLEDAANGHAKLTAALSEK